MSQISMHVSQLIEFYEVPAVQWKCRICRGRLRREADLPTAVRAAIGHLMGTHEASVR